MTTNEITITKVVRTKSYAKNGNLGNASERCYWVVKAGDKHVGITATQKAAKELAAEYLATEA